MIEEAKLVGIPVWSHCYNNHAAAYDSVRFGCEQLIHGFDIDERTMDLRPSRAPSSPPTIAFLPTWYATYPPVYVPELHDKYEGTLVEKELQRNYDCLREAKKRGVVMTIGSDSFSFVTPYAPAPSRRCTSLSTRSASPRSRPSPAPPSTVPRCATSRTRPVPSRPASAPTCWSSTVRRRRHPRAQHRQHGRHHEGRLDRRGWHLWRGQQIQRLRYRLSMAGCKTQFLIA